MAHNRLMRYSWQHSDWPHFTYDPQRLQVKVIHWAQAMGHLAGSIAHLSNEDKEKAIIDMMVAEAIKTSEIEGEYLSREEVMSSIRNQLGLNLPPLTVQDKRADSNARVFAPEMLKHRPSDILEGVIDVQGRAIGVPPVITIFG